MVKNKLIGKALINLEYITSTNEKHSPAPRDKIELIIKYEP